MKLTVPTKRPQITKDELLEMIREAHPDFEIPPFFTCGIRGYYEDTMGEPGKNDRGIFDDAIFIVGKEEFHAFNGNTDPSVYKLAIASLKPGVWPVYKFDMHKGQYLALCQRGGNVTVVRDGKGEDTGMFGINQHRGGHWGTSSLGCQTVPFDQWKEFIDTATAVARKYYGKSYRSKSDYPYVLLENPAATDRS